MWPLTKSPRASGESGQYGAGRSAKLAMTFYFLVETYGQNTIRGTDDG